MLWPKYPVCYDSPHIPVCKTHLQCWDWSTKVLLWALVIHPHTHTHIHILYTHTHTQSSDGASGSATMFPGSLTGLMEALCLKPGQTAADSRGDAYQLLAMLRPRGEREGEREGERDKERERKRERGGYSKMHCIKKEPASVWKLGWNSAHLNTPAWHFKSWQVFVFFLRGPDIDIDVLLQQANDWNESSMGKGSSGAQMPSIDKTITAVCEMFPITAAVEAIWECWQVEWCMVKLWETHPSDTPKVNKEQDLSRCGHSPQCQSRLRPFFVPNPCFFLSSEMISDSLKLYAVHTSSFTLTGIVRWWAMIGTTKSGYKDKFNSFLPSFSPNLSLSLITKAVQGYESGGLADVVVDRSNACCLLHGDFLVRAWGWGGESWKDSHRDPRISTASVSGKLDYNGHTRGWVRWGRQEV